ncbi:DUF169 domain-containing protein [bacterium]|nr:DUF169 domain-containing protein [bacterium]
MNSALVRSLHLNPQPLVMCFAEEKPASALLHDAAKWGCVISLFKASAAGRIIVLDRDNYDCLMQGQGRCFEGEYSSIGLPNYAPDCEYIVLKPLRQVDAADNPQVICMFPELKQLDNLLRLANIDRPGRDAVFAPHATACQTAYLLPYHEGHQDRPRAVIGGFDYVSRQHISADKVTFALPWRLFEAMETAFAESA